MDRQAELFDLEEIREPHEFNTPAGKAIVRCRRCGRVLTNPESVALGIGPICRGRESGYGGYGGGGGPSKVHWTESSWPTHLGVCGCQITVIPQEFKGVTFAQECYDYCCVHCPSGRKSRCAAERLRTPGKLRSYPVSSTRYCLGFWREEEGQEILRAVFFETKDSEAFPMTLWAEAPQGWEKGLLGAEVEILGSPRSLLEAEIMAIQKTPLRRDVSSS
jgi:hypothetical protein